MSRERFKWVALAHGLLCHSIFLVAILWMLGSLHEGMGLGLGTLSGWRAWAANSALALQFPLLHSFLLSNPGRRWLARLAPKDLARDLGTTLFASAGALQVLLTFALWSPLGIVWYRPEGWALVLHEMAFVGAWLFLQLALVDGDLRVQSGSLGWTSVFKGRAPRFRPMPTERTFRMCRQPIYLGFALTLWTGPVWTPDRLLIALIWTSYCVVGPVLKERRFRQRYGEAFESYAREVPYILPRLRLFPGGRRESAHGDANVEGELRVAPARGREQRREGAAG